MYKLHFRTKYVGLLISILGLFFINCSSDDENTPPIPTGKTKEYTLSKTQFSDITGSINFIENTNRSTTVSIKLNNIVKGINVIARLRRNTANIGGGIAIDLNDIDNQTGESITTIYKLDNGTSISFEQLEDFEGYLAIEGNGDNEGILFAFKDLGPNELTGKKITYNLFSNNATINGFAQLEERKKGTSSLIVGLFETNNIIELPCTLHIKQENNNTEYIHQLSPIRINPKGYGFTELTEINNSLINFEDVLKLDGYINVTESNNTMISISKGSIGIGENVSSY